MRKRSSPIIDRSSPRMYNDIAVDGRNVAPLRTPRSLYPKNNGDDKKISNVIPPNFFKDLKIYVKTGNEKEDQTIIENISQVGGRIVDNNMQCDVVICKKSQNPMVNAFLHKNTIGGCRHLGDIVQTHKRTLKVFTNQISWAFHDGKKSNQLDSIFLADPTIVRIIVSDIRHRFAPSFKNFQLIENMPKLFLEKVPKHYYISAFQKVPSNAEQIAKNYMDDLGKKNDVQKQIDQRNTMFNEKSNYCYICKMNYENAEGHHGSIQHIRNTSQLWCDFDSLAESLNNF